MLMQIVFMLEFLFLSCILFFFFFAVYSLSGVIPYLCFFKEYNHVN